MAASPLRVLEQAFSLPHFREGTADAGGFTVGIFPGRNEVAEFIVIGALGGIHAPGGKGGGESGRGFIFTAGAQRGQCMECPQSGESGGHFGRVQSAAGGGERHGGRGKEMDGKIRAGFSSGL